MPKKSSTRKKITSAARKAAGKVARKVVKVVKAAPAKIKKVVKSAAAAAKRPRKAAPVKKTVAKPLAASPRVKPATKPAPKSKLPESYGTKRLFLVARDPRWLYAHWDFPIADQRAAARLATDKKLQLRIFQDSAKGQLIKQVAVEADARHWFVPVGRGETRYIAELGYHSRSGDWTSLAVSASTLTPSETISPDTSVTMATLPPDVPFQKILETLGAAVAENLPLTQVIRQFRAAGNNELPAVAVFSSGQQTTPKQAHTLTKLAGARSVRRRIVTELSSLTAANLLPKEAVAAVAVEATPLTPVAAKTGSKAFEESVPTSPTGGWSGKLT